MKRLLIGAAVGALLLPSAALAQDVPAPDQTAPPDQKPPNLVRVGIYQDGFTVNDVPATPELLDTALAKVASIDAGQTIMITVSAVSEHGQLVKALNLCAKNGLKSLSVVSASN